MPGWLFAEVVGVLGQGRSSVVRRRFGKRFGGSLSAVRRSGVRGTASRKSFSESRPVSVLWLLDKYELLFA